MGCCAVQSLAAISPNTFKGTRATLIVNASWPKLATIGSAAFEAAGSGAEGSKVVLGRGQVSHPALWHATPCPPPAFVASAVETPCP